MTMTVVILWAFRSSSHSSFLLLLLCVLLVPKLVESKCIDVDESKCHAWAGEGACQSNVAFMAEYCRKSCGLCNEEGTRGEEYDSIAQVVDGDADASASGDETKTTGGSTSRRSRSDSRSLKQKGRDETSKCKDLHDACPDMAQKNECLLHAHLMLRTCPETCNVCHLTVEEVGSLLDASNLGVPQLLGPYESKKIGLLLRDAEEAFGNLVKKLGSMDVVHEKFGHCRNRDVNCAYWAAKGYCHTTKYMEDNCGPVCRVCY